MSKLFLLISLSSALLLADGRTLFRSPTVNKTHIVFAYADDLWIVGRAGGPASRLTAGEGMETDPIFSPDGSMVAFTGEYDGNVDVFMVPATGGVPKRLTYHPGVDRAAGWSPDGKQVLYSHVGSSNSNMPRLYTVELNAGFPKEMPLPIGADGAYSPDGKSLAYLPWARADQAWKRYRGGRAAAIWVANLSDSSVTKIPRTDSNDHTPMWIGNTIYFLSDRNGPYTLFSYDVPSKKVTQLLEAKGLDIKDANASSDVIAYEQFGEISLFDLKSKKATKVNITLDGDLLSVRPRMEKLAQSMRNPSLSPTGVRVAVEARGEIFTIPAEKGDIRNLTNSQGVADRSPSWSPDGKWIAYFSDESGEYQLHLRDQSGRSAVTKITLEAKPTFYYELNWSPDSKKLAYVDKRGQVWYVDIEKKQPVLVDKAVYEGARTDLLPRWAPDSQWIAYSKQLKSGISAICVYSVPEAKVTQVTDGLSDAHDAAWDKNGKYLYFTASTDSGPGLLGLDMASNNRPITRSIYLTVLQKSDVSPLAPESDEEKPVEDKKPEAKPDAKKVEVKIDFDQISQRMIPLPVPARNYDRLTAGKTGILFFLEAPVVQAAFNGPGSVSLHKFDLSKRKSDLFLAGAGSFVVSANGEKILMSSGPGRWALAGTAAPPRPGEGALRTDQLEAIIDPVAEWRQMYKETWRLERDFFYDPGFHGLDLQAAAERYELFLRNVGSRNDLNYLFNEMLGELSVGHLFVRGGDQLAEPKQVTGGLLGADYKLENGRYRFAKVLEGDNWSPQTRAPLTQPGVNVKAGEYLIAIDGREVKDTDNVYEALEGKGNKTVLLKVGPNANGEGAREVSVTPIPNEGQLRTLTWVEENRVKVDKASGGKLAYMHLPDTAFGGYRNFNRYYFAQADKQGAVIDERFNSGGQAADYIIDHLRRPIWNYWSARDGETYSTPGMLMQGPKVMLANEYSGSGGDLLPWLFKRAKLGPVIGKRTWGGLVGIGGYPPLVDGGTVTAPHFAFFSPEGKWEVENHGTDVDIEVDLDPKAWREGRDSQLDKAIEIALAELKKNPVVMPQKPAFPNYQKK